ncbi:hypothetical protein ACFE04_003461 [Oxalis oulophora]
MEEYTTSRVERREQVIRGKFRRTSLVRNVGSNEPQAQPPRPDVAPQSWYPPSVASPSSSLPSTPGGSSSGSFNSHRPHSPSQVSPSEAAGIVSLLKDKSIDELRKLLSDKEAYQQFLLSLDQVKTQNNIRDELRKETLQLARDNLEKEPRINELRNQCRIIRTTELATAQEKLNELERQKEEILKFYSPVSIQHRLQEGVHQADEESEDLHRQFLDGEMELVAFVQKYKKLRTTYQRRSLINIAVKSSAAV